MKGGGFSSLIAPLQVPIFRSLWLATVASNIGTLMHGVGAAWLMTSMTTNPLLVGLVPACIFLPTFLVGFWGGVLSDIIERRKILIVTQSGMLVCALSIGACTVLGLMSPALLLALTFCLGAFSAANLPAWQSQIQEMVPPDQVAAAVSLNSMSFNTARSVGPALGGLIVSATGPSTVFFLNAASFLGTIAVLARWRRPPRTPVQAAVWRSFREGLAYVTGAPVMRAPLVRVSAFAFSGSAIWALLPLLAREGLGTGAAGYGAMLAAFGTGSVAGAGFLPWLRNRHHPDRLIAAAISVLAGVFFVLSLSGHYAAVCSALFLGGIAWVCVLVQLNVAVQLSAPDALRGRAMSFYLVFFQGSMGVGSAFHGWLARSIGIHPALMVAGCALMIGIPLLMWFPLVRADGAPQPGTGDLAG